MKCWETALAPVSKKLRALLGPDALIYTNECANKGITEVPPDFDLISVDTYAGYTPGSKGADEVTKAKAMYDIIFPKLHAEHLPKRANVVTSTARVVMVLAPVMAVTVQPPVQE